MSPVKLEARIEYKSQLGQLLNAARHLNRAALLRIAEVVAARAKELVPVVSGRLKESIKGKVRKRRGEDELMASISTNTRKAMKKEGIARYGKGAPISTYGYGLDVEIGRPSGNYKSTPYLRPAIVQSEAGIRAIYQEEAARAAAAQKDAAGKAA